MGLIINIIMNIIMRKEFMDFVFNGTGRVFDSLGCFYDFIQQPMPEPVRLKSPGIADAEPVQINPPCIADADDMVVEPTLAVNKRKTDNMDKNNCYKKFRVVE